MNNPELDCHGLNLVDPCLQQSVVVPKLTVGSNS